MNASAHARWGAPVAIAALAVAIASCSGGGNVSSTPQAAPSAGSGASAAATVAVAASGGTVSLPTVDDVASTLSFGTVPSGTTLKATVSTKAPAGAPATALHRKTAAAVPGGTAFFYITFTTNEVFSAAQLTGEAVTVPAAVPSGASIYAELDDITSIANPVDIADFGPATVANGTATIANTATGTLPALSTTDTYLIQFYYVAASGASPSPSPSPSAPSSSPSPHSSASPSPSASASPASSPSPGTSPSSSPSGGDGLPYFTFDGGNDYDSCVATISGSCSSPPLFSTDGSVQVSATFPTSAVSATPSPVDIYLQVATSTSQISPSGSFPAFTGSGTVYAYIAVNAGTSFGASGATGSVQYSATPTLTVMGVSGTTCNVYAYSNNSTNGTPSYSWATGPYPAATVSAGMVTFESGPPSGGGNVNLNAQQFLIAIACSSS